MDIRTAAYQDLLTMSELIADAVIKKTDPVKDDITYREACKCYGARWMQTMVSEGRAKGHRISNRLIFSRHELDTLRAVERTYAKLITDPE